MSAPRSTDPTQPIAIVGMAGRFPGAADLDGLWQLMIAGGDAIGPVPAGRWDAAQLAASDGVPQVGGFLDRLDALDPMFFGISPREAEDIDPQQRLMLELSWQALEDAGRPASQLRGSRTGVYVGASWHDYELLRKERNAPATSHSAVGNALDVIAARVSYFLALRGPSLAVETGCSSSLVALHLAVQAMRTGEIDGALVGGVNLMLAPDVSIGLTRFGGLSPDGRCKAFAASANGFVRGEGAIAIYVKPLARAIADGDRIRGVIVGTAVNNDGGGASLVTPSLDGQRALLAQAYADAGVALDDVAYVEAHGTGTAIGDPIEAGALGAALGQPRTRGPLAIGSVKTNIGHLEAAAGLAGLVKAVMALEHRVVPPSLHAEVLNPKIDFDALGLHVVRAAQPLPAGQVYAGVNSFGWGGTNAHVILRSVENEMASVRVAGPVVAPVVVPVSAHSDVALRQRMTEIAAGAGGVELGDLAGTLAWRRDHLRSRAAVVVDSIDELATKLAAIAVQPEIEHAGAVQGTARAVGRTAFVFPGQGAQWAGMGRALLASSPTFAREIQRCADALAPYVDWNLTACLAGEVEWSAIDRLQPVLWAMAVGLAAMWREAGVTPDVVIGHSQGEVAAATVAGILSYDDAARVVARRSQILRGATGQGLMLAVELGVAAAQAALEGFEDRVSLAVNNGPTSCVLSGDAEAVSLLHALLEADGVFCRLVKVDYASHSPYMDALAPALIEALAGVAPQAAAIPMMSTVEVSTEIACDAAYWVRNLRAPVRFADAMTALLDGRGSSSAGSAEGVTHVIEISPHPVLALAIEQLAAGREACVLTTLRRDAGSARDFAMALARAYVAGLAPFGGVARGAQVALPAYPWQRQTCWIGGRSTAARRGLSLTLAPAPGERDTWHGATELAVDAQPWLADHQVHDAVIVPATAMLALMLEAARARTGAVPARIVGIEFSRALVLDAPVQIDAAWRDEGRGNGCVVLRSLADGAAAWTEHATAYAQADGGIDEIEFPAALMSGEMIDAEAFYRACASRGLRYGAAFQGVARLFLDGDEALGELRSSARPVGLPGPHPALCDAALQVSLALCDGERTVVPTAIARVTMISDATPRWSHAVRRDANRFDVTLFDGEAQPVMVIEGLTLTALATTAAQDDDLARLHRLRLVAAERTTQAGAAGAWLVCGAAADGASELAAVLGAQVVRDSDDVRDASEWRAILRAGRAPAGVAFVVARRALDTQRRQLASLVALIQACASTAVRLVVVTAGAAAASPDEQPDPGAALFAGLLRVVAREHAALRPLLLDIDPDVADWAARCAAELDTREDHVALRADQRFVARLERGGAGMIETRAWTTPAQPFRAHVAAPGRFDAMEFRPLRRRAPGAGEIEVEVTAASLNFFDVMKAMGTYPGAAATVLGGECAGRVVAVGAGVPAMRLGDRVIACAAGSFASHVTVRADHAQHIPSDVADEAAAGLPLVLSTAWYALAELARLTAGETVLIHSAAGGLGLAAIQVARRLGARVLATAGNDAKRAFLRARGVADVFDSRDLAWVEGVRAATHGAGVDVVLNSLTGAAIARGLDVLAEDGRFIEVGKQDIYGGRALAMAAFQKRITIAAVDLAGLIERKPARFARTLAAAWAQVCSGAIRPLPTKTWAFAEVGEALRTMARGQHIGKLVLTAPASVRHVAPEALVDGKLRGDATYLITGGLGALGLSLAEHFASLGAGALALVGRSAPNPDACRRVDALRANGMRVELFAVDVADGAAVERTLGAIRRTMPALRGVVHAAGILDDAMLAQLAPAQLARVLAPKVDGARHLDAATAQDALDLFVLFSSAAALVGNAGQAAYAAANAYLDALAVARRRQGRAALSVQWGPFVDVGLAAQDARRGERLAERGMTGFTTAEAWRALERFLASDEPVVGYVPLDVRRWLDAYPETAAQPTWQALRATASSTVATTDGFRSELVASAEPQVLAEAKIRELASRVLRLVPERIDRETPFKSLGLDSLLGLELRNRLETAFGLTLPPTLLWTYGTSRALAGVLCERVRDAAR